MLYRSQTRGTISKVLQLFMNTDFEIETMHMEFTSETIKTDGIFPALQVYLVNSKPKAVVKLSCCCMLSATLLKSNFWKRLSKLWFQAQLIDRIDLQKNWFLPGQNHKFSNCFFSRITNFWRSGFSVKLSMTRLLSLVSSSLLIFRQEFNKKFSQSWTMPTIFIDWISTGLNSVPDFSRFFGLLFTALLFVC